MSTESRMMNRFSKKLKFAGGPFTKRGNKKAESTFDDNEFRNKENGARRNTKSRPGDDRQFGGGRQQGSNTYGMGTVIGKAANGFGSVVGNAIVAPFKSIFGESCQEVCFGPWDLVCFIEHLCVTDLVKLLMILGLCYITLLFFYLLFKLGLCQCIIKSLCKMCWAACETYWYALEDITCFLWHKLMNTKRVNRRRQRQRRLRDIELGYSSSPESETHLDNYHRSSTSRKRKSYRERRKNPVPYHSSRHSSLRHNHVRLKTRGISIRVKGGSRRLKNPRQLQLSKMRNLRRKGGRCKRRKLR